MQWAELRPQLLDAANGIPNVLDPQTVFRYESLSQLTPKL